MKLEELFEIIQERKKNLPEDSYIASLFKEGDDRIIQKVGEESVEVIIAAKNNNKKLLKGEIADLIFHLLVLMAVKNLNPREILSELENRRKK